MSSARPPPADDDHDDSALLDFGDLIDWPAEAHAVIADVGPHVRDIRIAGVQPPTRTHIHLNVQTLEERRLCVRLCSQGFRVVGHDYDQVLDGEADEAAVTYETPYALLGAMSGAYTKSFADVLSGALQKVADDRRRSLAEEEVEQPEEAEEVRK